MADSLVGSSWSNPIRYRSKWRIYADPDGYNWLGKGAAFVHDDYDGAPDANDRRHGYARTVEQAKQEIDDMEEA